MRERWTAWRWKGAADAAIAQASQAKPELFELIFERHYDAVFTFLARRCGRDAAADLAADVFVVAFRRRHDVDGNGSSSVRPWLFGIARNLLGARYRARARRPELLPLNGVDVVADGFETRVLNQHAVDRALRELSSRDRQVLVLRHLDELTYEEMADLLSVSVGTVRSRLYRARDRLEHVLAATEGAAAGGV